jgi:hypothetical protein
MLSSHEAPLSLPPSLVGSRRLWSMEDMIRFSGVRLYSLLDVLVQRAKAAAATDPAAEVRIPGQGDRRFQSNVTTDSRSKVTTDSGGKVTTLG